MATKLTVKYIDDHMNFNDQSALELGKKFGELILKEAKESILKNGNSDSIKFEGTFELKSHEGVCVDIQICLPFVGCVTSHVGV